MKDLVITVNTWSKNENNEFSTLSTIYTTTSVDNLRNFIKTGNILDGEDVVILIWEDGVMQHAFNSVNASSYDQILENINYICQDKEKGCDFCRNDGVKLTTNVDYWDLPENTHGISANLVFNNMGNEAVLSVESNYKDSCYIEHGYVSNIINIQYCPVCGRKLIP